MALGKKASDISPPVKTRRVHYISGFDPRGARYYHRLYREEAAKQTPHLGATLEVGDRRRLSPLASAWTIQGEWEGHAVTTEYEFLAWDDLVRKDWDSSLWKLARRSVPYYVNYTLSGCFARVRRVSKSAFNTALYPLACMVVVTLAILLLMLICAEVTEALAGHRMPGILAALAIGLIFIWKMRPLAERLGVFWILRTCVFAYEWGVHPQPELEERINEMAQRITAQQRTHPVDEVLIVGHSVGSILAVAVTSRILQEAKDKELPPNLNLLTLGQCIPYLTFIPSATAFRETLQTLGTDARIPWTDATAPPDPLCFFGVDPIEISGLKQEFKDRPKRVAVRVFRMFSAPVYARMRLNKLRLHFQYLMASELLSEYDFFLITAGPKKLHPTRSPERL